MKIKLDRIFLYIFLSIFAVILVGPFIWLASSSFKESKDIFSTTFSLLPRHDDGSIYFSFDNYKYAFEYLNLGTLFFNTLFVAVIATFVNLILNSLAGYAFARLNFRGREVIFKILLVSLMIPSTVLLVPNMIIVNQLGLYDTLWALILPFTMSVYNVFLMRQHFYSLSKELEEAAIIDGASWFTIFWKIAMPLAKPILVILGIFTFMWNYNNYMWPLVVITTPENYTLSLGLGALISAADKNAELYPVMIAGSVMVALPLIIVFLFLQKHIMKGINIGGVKG
ncbi:carbohydrate ABC transporter permease [Cytobacillus sp. IB215665]|uniref:carbohydrate ABC transporter permease n=1 Tax=Cytobacillus sp. IB215665 TaxID=3097357 RepID=UPI002A109E2F|nr:carbohydrate ABC transporter permease [Cytobacillus sp. IB215665]MDX8366146.1 carbohydrate ABC transporter permease [Cytobacillus sp. IB215665]